MTQYNVTLTPMLRGEIIVAQSSEKGVTHIKRRLAKGDPKVDCFCVDEEGSLRFKDWLVVGTLSCERRFLMRLILPNIPSTLQHEGPS
jgi:hypothetical protein